MIIIKLSNVSRPSSCLWLFFSFHSGILPHHRPVLALVGRLRILAPSKPHNSFQPHYFRSLYAFIVVLRWWRKDSRLTYFSRATASSRSRT
jgi:hypothetical protein